MQLGAIVFIIPWKALYMFRLLFTPIIGCTKFADVAYLAEEQFLRAMEN
jgi:hypothetical protein